MHETLTILRRELKSYFYSPIAYVFGLLFLVTTCWVLGSQMFVMQNMQADLSQWFMFFPLLFLFFLPALTMRLWAEERKSGTLELLLTFPVTIPQLIAGKFLASLSYLVVLLLLTFLLPITMGIFGDLDWMPVLATYLAAVLLAGSYTAVGMFWSSITRDQIIAFLLALVTLAFLYFMPTFIPLLMGKWPVWLGGDAIVLFALALSPQQYFGSISRGVVDSGDLVYYVCFCAFFLHANALVLHWKKIKG